jgi:hypothetical protein
MQKITIVGNDSAAKNALMIALDPIGRVIDLQPEQITKDNISPISIYVDKDPSQQVIDALEASPKFILVAKNNNSYSNFGIGLFIPIKIFQTFGNREAITYIRLIREYINRSDSRRPKLDENQRRVFNQLAKNLLDQENCDALAMGRSNYFVVIKQLKILYGVDDKWRLIQLSQDRQLAQVA